MAAAIVANFAAHSYSPIRVDAGKDPRRAPACPSSAERVELTSMINNKRHSADQLALSEFYPSCLTSHCKGSTTPRGSTRMATGTRLPLTLTAACAPITEVAKKACFFRRSLHCRHKPGA